MECQASTKVKLNPKLLIVMFSLCLGVGRIASQCPNKITMIARVDGDVEIESDNGDEQYHHLRSFMA